MKQFLSLLTLTGLMFLLTGCPVGVDYPLSAIGSEPIDKRLLGKWTTDNTEAEFREAMISKKDDNTFSVEISETSEMYSLETNSFTAWNTSIDGYNFIYCLPEDDSKYYIYSYRLDGKQLKLYDVSFLIKGTDGISSTSTLREEISGSLKRDSCLTMERIFTKE